MLEENGSWEWGRASQFFVATFSIFTPPVPTAKVSHNRSQLTTLDYHDSTTLKNLTTLKADNSRFKQCSQCDIYSRGSLLGMRSLCALLGDAWPCPHTPLYPHN